MFFSSKQSILGVDIGTANIKLVQLRKQSAENKWILETYGIVNAIYHITKAEDRPVIERTAEVLSTLLKQARVSTRRIVASLPNNVVFISVLELPSMPDSDLASAVEWEAKRFVPQPLEDVSISWEVLERNKSGGLRVLLTAVPKHVVENYLHMFKLAHLTPLVFEIEGLAYTRSLIQNKQENAIIVDIGAKSTNVTLVTSGLLQFSKNIMVGGDTITASIAQVLGVNFLRAEQFKKDFVGLEKHGANSLPPSISTILDAIKAEVEKLRTLYETKGQRIHRIILTGGGIRLAYLADYFSSLGVPVEIGNPWHKVAYHKRLASELTSLGTQLSCAVGLAMRES
jgi:type IV pilus assembly protein PilM